MNWPEKAKLIDTGPLSVGFRRIWINRLLDGLDIGSCAFPGYWIFVRSINF